MGSLVDRSAVSTATVAAALTAVSLAGCMTVIIESRDAPVRVHQGYGVLRIELPQVETAVAGTITGAGITATPMGWQVGYTTQRWAAIGPRCQAIVWLDAGPIDEPTRRWLDGLQQVCSFDRHPATAAVTTTADDAGKAPGRTPQGGGQR